MTKMQSWIKIDATDKSFGRLATRIASLLQGKDLPNYQPNVAVKRHILIINCANLAIPIRRKTAIKYHHTDYIGNLKEEKFIDRPLGERLFNAVKLMLPKNKLSRRIIKNLHCVEGKDHNFKAQIK